MEYTKLEHISRTKFLKTNLNKSNKGILNLNFFIDTFLEYNSLPYYKALSVCIWIESHGHSENEGGSVNPDTMGPDLKSLYLFLKSTYSSNWYVYLNKAIELVK